MSIPDLLGDARPESIDSVRALLERVRAEHASYFASPVDWADEVLYFLLPDRFSDGNDGARPLLTRDEIMRLREAPSRPDWNWQQWAQSGKRWQGGTIQGITGRLDYLQNLGVTAIWVGPVFKQRVRSDSYHGYGIQDFLDVDPRFGARRDLLALVSAAHARSMRIILDVIVNHSGDNWGYVPPGAAVAEAQNEPPYRPWPSFYGAPNDCWTRGWQLAWRNEWEQGFTTHPEEVGDRHDAVWPQQFRDQALYTKAGMGNLGEANVEYAHAEHKRTDFYALKDFALDAPHTLEYLVDCYKYWIAVSDCDGFRIDTVKHMALEETRNFCGAIREFAASIGKPNFLLVGEIAGGDANQDFVLDHLAQLKRNLSAALDIGGARPTLHRVAKGDVAAAEYFDMFNAWSDGFDSHRSFGNRHVSIVDDHDHVSGPKVRFSAPIPDDSPVKDYQVAIATALQLFTLGIPCIYYGTEQAFAGPAHSQLQFVRAEGWNDGSNYGDRYLREAMFGPEHPRGEHAQDLETQLQTRDTCLPGFGPFGTAGQHCFDTQSPSYVRIASLCRARAAHLVLRQGRQYARQTRVPGQSSFEYPAPRQLVAWSRILDTEEAVVVINPNSDATLGADVVVSAELSKAGAEFRVIANTAHAAAGDTPFAGGHAVGTTVRVEALSRLGEPAFLAIRGVAPAETLVLVKH